jgi:flagellar M-ring protein FliF
MRPVSVLTLSMENATLQPLNGAAVAAAAPPTFWTRLLALPMPRKLMLAGGLVALVVLLVASLMMSRDDDYKVLFANLSDKDGGAIIAQLSQLNVPYKYTEGGTAILVPANKVHDVRLKLAQAGLPKGGTIGFELMDNARFGTTQFQERLNFQRGLEGELVRSMTSMAAVEAARVHLALPQQNGFFREQQKPSASVLLTLHPGRTLDRAQIAGIVHLVASSVPELNPKAVSILDQTGALLSGPDEGMAKADGLDAQQLQYVNQLETQYTKRVSDLLEPVIGRDNLRAQVTADVDFTQTEQTSEEFKPNQNPDAAAVRSAQTSEQNNGGALQPSGVPGAASNQPPGPTSAPINGAAAPLQAGTGNGGATGGNAKREAVTNYEVDKTVRVTRAASGTIKRLTAAVVVNHRSSTDKKGNVQSVPLSPEELDKLTSLVQEAVGFNKDRGDSVKVINAPFQVEKPVVENTPLWQQPQAQDLVRTLAGPLGLALLAAIVVFGAIRPVLKQTNPQALRVEAVVDDGAELPGLLADGSPAGADGAGGHAVPALPAPEEPKIDLAQERLNDVRRIAVENPAAVANILRGWISANA